MNIYMKIDMGSAKEPKEYIKIMDKPQSHERSRTEIKKSGNSLVIRISAKDAHSLMASLNSVAKQLRIISNTSALISEKEKQ